MLNKYYYDDDSPKIKVGQARATKNLVSFASYFKMLLSFTKIWKMQKKNFSHL